MKDEELNELMDVVRLKERHRSTLEERLQLAEDHRELANLVMAYGWLCDLRNWDELLELYTDDFERELAGTLDERVVGKEAVRALYLRPTLTRKDAGAAGPPPAEVMATYELRHMIHPPVIKVADDNLSAKAGVIYGLVVTKAHDDGVARGEHEGIYIFDFRKDAARGWQIAKMRIISENALNQLFQAKKKST